MIIKPIYPCIRIDHHRVNLLFISHNHHWGTTGQLPPPAIMKPKMLWSRGYCACFFKRTGNMRWSFGLWKSLAMFRLWLFLLILIISYLISVDSEESVFKLLIQKSIVQTLEKNQIILQSSNTVLWMCSFGFHEGKSIFSLETHIPMMVDRIHVCVTGVCQEGQRLNSFWTGWTHQLVGLAPWNGKLKHP